jgi:hypothetical protein
MRSLLSIALLSSISFTGCPLDLDPDPPVCTTEFRYGVTAQVTDASTGAAVTNATLTLIEGSYTETMQFLPPGTYVGAGEREGTYTLVAEAPGYQTQTITGIDVDADECHVIGKLVQVALIPE